MRKTMWIPLAMLGLGACEVDSEELGAMTEGLTSRVVQEDPGRFISVSGEDCGSASNGQVHLQGVWGTPDYVQQATVFLNGWHARYKYQDKHVREIGVEMVNVVFAPTLNALVWNVEGTLADKGWDDEVEICYSYTAIGWASTAINARVVDQAGTDGHIARGDTSLTEITSTVTSPFGTADKVAILPRGFKQYFDDMKSWYDPRCSAGQPFGNYCYEDFHIAQLAYHLGQDSDAGTGITWSSRGVIRDNDATHDVIFDSHAVVLGGTGVQTVVPSYSIRSQAPAEGCGAIGAVQGERWTQVTVPDLHYDYVVPVLTGWNLRFQCDDEHLKNAGVAIRSPSYDRATGTLTYYLHEALADQNNAPAFTDESQVVLLGFRRKLHLPVPIGDLGDLTTLQVP